MRCHCDFRQRVAVTVFREQRPERRKRRRIVLAHVIDCVEARVDQDLRLASLASVAAMSVYHFARRFKETVGMSPHAYVLSRRLDRAQQMLRRRDRSLADIAVACGFSSQAHFTTAFRSAFGATPDKYRRSFT